MAAGRGAGEGEGMMRILSPMIEFALSGIAAALSLGVYKHQDIAAGCLMGVAIFAFGMGLTLLAEKRE